MPILNWINTYWKKEVIGDRDSKSLNCSNKVTFFTHIPKTAGTSFITLLDRLFDESHIYPEQLWREVNKVDPVENEQYRLFRGHFGGGGVKLLTNKPIEYLTILRNPIDLSVSTWRYVQREKNTAVHSLLQQSDFDLSAFLQHPRTKHLVENRMVRHLSFDFVEDPDGQEVFLSNESLQRVEQFVAKQYSPIDDAQRHQRAQRFLEACAWFGLQDRFDESLQLLCYRYHLPPIGQTQKLNIKKTQHELSAEEKQQLKQVNQWDMRLYDQACALFQARYVAMKTELEEYRTAKEQSVDDLLDQRYRSKQTMKKQSYVDFECAHALLGSGWHRRELMLPENSYFRWSGPEHQSFIDFCLQSADYTLSIRIVNGITENVLNTLSIYANDHLLEWRTNEQGVVRIITASIPASFIHASGLLRLSFDVAEVQTHAQAFGSDDERLLSFALHWIKIDPCQNLN